MRIHYTDKTTKQLWFHDLPGLWRMSFPFLRNECLSHLLQAVKWRIVMSSSPPAHIEFCARQPGRILFVLIWWAQMGEHWGFSKCVRAQLDVKAWCSSSRHLCKLYIKWIWPYIAFHIWYESYHFNYTEDQICKWHFIKCHCGNPALCWEPSAQVARVPQSHSRSHRSPTQGPCRG